MQSLVPPRQVFWGPQKGSGVPLAAQVNKTQTTCLEMMSLNIWTTVAAPSGLQGFCLTFPWAGNSVLCFEGAAPQPSGERLLPSPYATGEMMRGRGYALPAVLRFLPGAQL